MADLTSQYTAQVREALRASQGPMTIAELQAATRLSDRLVRIGVGVLTALGEATESRRHIPGQRGAMPLQYQLTVQQA